MDGLGRRVPGAEVPRGACGGVVMMARDPGGTVVGMELGAEAGAGVVGWGGCALGGPVLGWI